MSLINFSFVIPKQLAGMGRPFSGGDAAAGNVRELQAAGIGAVVNLTASASDAEAVVAAGIAYLQLPVTDFSPPSLAQVAEFVAFTQTKIDAGVGVVVHCAAGCGRTGTMLACYLVYTGKSATEAIRTVRLARPGSIETHEQEQCVHDYAAQLQDDRAQ